MPPTMFSRGRNLADEDFEFIRTLIRSHPVQSRTALARQLALHWSWRQANGNLKVRACLDILNRLEGKGLIPPLPALQTRQKSSAAVLPLPLERPPFAETCLRDLQPLSIVKISSPSDSACWNRLMRAHHYLGFRVLVGAHLKYFVYSAQKRLLAALGWESAVWKLGARDRAIGWLPEIRKNNLHKIANNSRFLILPEVRIPHLASHILALNIRRLSQDWQEVYGHPLALLETFVDPQRFTGTSYRAANWIRVGRTRGYSKSGRTFVFHGQPKEVYLYPLSDDFRKQLGVVDRDLPPLAHGFSPLLPPTSSSGGKPMPCFFSSQYDLKKPPLFDLHPDDISGLLQELESFHNLFSDAWGRLEHVPLSAAYLQGLMSALPRKSVEPIALHTLGPGQVTNLQRFIDVMGWDENILARRHKEEAAQLTSDPEGVFSVDGSDFPKKGTESVGVARQYCGRLGKTDNCQAGVFLAYSSPKGHVLLDRRLYLPESWFSQEQKKRWKKCRIPDETVFKTKPQLALEMVRNIHASNLFRGRWVTCDDAFGNSPDFIDHLPNDLLYLADIPSSTRVWKKPPRWVTPVYSGSGRPPKPRLQSRSLSVAQIAADPSLVWHKVTLGEGAKGPRRARVARLRVTVTRNHLPAHEVWLFIRKACDSGEIKYALSNAPWDVTLEEMIRVSSLRWPIEQCFQEGKSEIGMDHYEHRSWSAWHRHMTFVFLAQLCLLRLRLCLKKNSCSHLAPNLPFIEGHSPHENF